MLRNLYILLLKIFIFLLKVIVPPLIGFYVFAYSLAMMTSYFRKPFTEKDQQEFAVWVRGAKQRHENRMKGDLPTSGYKPNPPLPKAPRTIAELVKEAKQRHEKRMKGDLPTSGYKPSSENPPMAPKASKE